MASHHRCRNSFGGYEFLTCYFSAQDFILDEHLVNISATPFIFKHSLSPLISLLHHSISIIISYLLGIHSLFRWTALCKGFLYISWKFICGKDSRFTWTSYLCTHIALYISSPYCISSSILFVS